MAGVRSAHPAIGRDLTSEAYAQGAGRAFMQRNRIAAFMAPGRVVVTQPDMPGQSFLYQPGVASRPGPEPDPEPERTALAYSGFAPLLIERKAYHTAAAPWAASAWPTRRVHAPGPWAKLLSSW